MRVNESRERFRSCCSEFSVLPWQTRDLCLRWRNVFLLKNYYKFDDNRVDVFDKFHLQYPDAHLYKLANKFERTGSVLGAPRQARFSTTHTKKNMQLVAQTFVDTPRASNGI